jgi:2-polyprenyl-3-methyl-5-hydroxy-6-metoxy-1,4-benzoquinol methylase
MSEQYGDYIYTSLDPSNKESGKKLANFLISIIIKQEHVRTICDLGCGNGYLANRLADLGYYVIGIDASRSGIHLAKETYISNNLEFSCMPIDSRLSEKMQDKELDLVVSSDVIEHLYRPSDLIEVVLRLLKPAGHFLISTPYHGYLKNVALSLLNRWDFHHGVDWDGGHIKFFSVKTLKDLIERYGFENMHFYFYGRGRFLWKNMICHARKGY